MRRLATGGRNGTLRHFSMVSRRCSGVVPQQPPSACTPMPAISSIRSENSAGAISNTVLPFSLRGRPAFGLTMIGSELTCVSRSMIGCICFGPRPQLTPSASTRKALEHGNRGIHRAACQQLAFFIENQRYEHGQIAVFPWQPAQPPWPRSCRSWFR